MKCFVSHAKTCPRDVLTHTFSFDRLIRQQLDVLDQYIKDNRSCIVHTGKNFICYVLIKRLVKCKEKPHLLLYFYGHFQQKKNHISCLIFMATFNKRKVTFPAWFLWPLSTLFSFLGRSVVFRSRKAEVTGQENWQSYSVIN